MYNRYTSHDTGDFSPVEPLQQQEPPPQQPPHHRQPPHQPPPSDAPPVWEKLRGLLSGLLGKFTDLDSGDLLLLAMLYLLYRDGGDEELMIAIGLLFLL